MADVSGVPKPYEGRCRSPASSDAGSSGSDAREGAGSPLESPSSSGSASTPKGMRIHAGVDTLGSSPATPITAARGDGLGSESQEPVQTFVSCVGDVDNIEMRTFLQNETSTAKGIGARGLSPATPSTSSTGRVPGGSVPGEVLGVMQVRMPEARIREHNGTTYFGIEIIPEGGWQAWVVPRRFSHFRDFSQQLLIMSRSYLRISPDAGLDSSEVREQWTQFIGAKFPRRHVFSCKSGSRLQARRAALERWFQCVLRHPLGKTQWLGPLRNFLEVTPARLPPLKSEAGDGEFPRRRFSPSATEEAETTESSEFVMIATDGVIPQTWQAQLPWGTHTGQQVPVQFPDGSRATVEVPFGASPRSKLQLWRDAKSAKVRVLSFS